MIIYKGFLLFLLNIVFFFTPANALAAHPFYISVTEIKHDVKTHSLEISCKMFTEDLEDVLKQNYKVAVDLGNDKLQEQNGKLVNDYILKHLSITTDSKAGAIKFVGFEKDKESVYCYFEVLNAANVKKLTIINSLLHDYKQEQINIIHVIVNGNRKSTKLDFPDTQASFDF